VKEILGRIKNVFKPGTKLAATANGNDYAAWHSLFPTSYESALSIYRSFCYSCINVRAEAVMGGKILLYKQQLNKQKEIFEHPFLDLINKANIYGQSFTDILFLISSVMDLDGNSYCLEYQNDNSPFKIPEGLIVFPTNSITPVLNYNSTAIEYYQYSGGGQSINYLPEQIIHFKIPNPENMFYGKSTVSALKIPLEIDYHQSQYQKSFYENFAAIGQILSVEGKLQPEQKTSLREQLSSNYSSPSRAGKTLVLDGGMTAKPLTSTPKEADYKESRIANRDEIMSIFRVPKSIMAITDDVNRANATATIRGFLFNTIIPYSKFIESKLQDFVRRNYDTRLILKLDYSLQNDRELQLRFYDIALRNGLLTRNEIREQENYEYSLDPKANELVVSGNGQPVDTQTQT
jgi:HK97 family phage portal protein